MCKDKNSIFMLTLASFTGCNLSMLLNFSVPEVKRERARVSGDIKIKTISVFDTIFFAGLSFLLRDAVGSEDGRQNANSISDIKDIYYIHLHKYMQFNMLNGCV